MNSTGPSRGMLKAPLGLISRKNMPRTNLQKNSTRSSENGSFSGLATRDSGGMRRTTTHKRDLHSFWALGRASRISTKLGQLNIHTDNFAKPPVCWPLGKCEVSKVRKLKVMLGSRMTTG